MSRTLSGLFLVGALNWLRKRKGTNRENPWTIPEQIGKIPEKSGKGPKKDKKGRTSPDRETPPFETPPFETPRLAALDASPGTKEHESFKCAFGPLSSHPFSLIIPPSSLQALFTLPQLLPSSPPPLAPLFLTPGELRFRYPSDLCIF